MKKESFSQKQPPNTLIQVINSLREVGKRNQTPLKDLILGKYLDLKELTENFDLVKTEIVKPFLTEIIKTLELKTLKAILSLDIENTKDIVRELYLFRYDLKNWVLACNKVSKSNITEKFSILKFLDNFHTTDLIAFSQHNLFQKLDKSKNKDLDYHEITGLILLIDEFIEKVIHEFYPIIWDIKHLYKLNDAYFKSVMNQTPDLLEKRDMAAVLKNFINMDKDFTLNLEEINSIFLKASNARSSNINYATPQGFDLMQEILDRNLVVKIEQFTWSVVIIIFIYTNFELSSFGKQLLTLLELFLMILLSTHYFHARQFYDTLRVDFVKKAILIAILDQAKKTPNVLNIYTDLNNRLQLTEIKKDLFS